MTEFVNPALVYLARLGAGSRLTQARALETIARLISGGEAGMDEFDWARLGYPVTQAVRTHLTERYAPATVNRHLSALRGVLRESFRLELIDAETFARAADLPGVPGSRLPAGRHVSPVELLALFQDCARDPRASGARDAALIAVLAGAGLRRAEVVALDLDDVDLDQGALRVLGKDDRERRAFLADGGAQALAEWIVVRGSALGPLFIGVDKAGRLDPGRRRLSPDAVPAILRRRARRADLPRFSAHDMRRTFIGEALDAGADLATVQHLVGHASVATTARYDGRPIAARAAARRVRLPPVVGTRTAAASPASPAGARAQ